MVSRISPLEDHGAFTLAANYGKFFEYISSNLRLARINGRRNSIPAHRGIRPTLFFKDPRARYTHLNTSLRNQHQHGPPTSNQLPPNARNSYPPPNPPRPLRSNLPTAVSSSPPLTRPPKSILLNFRAFSPPCLPLLPSNHGPQWNAGGLPSLHLYPKRPSRPKPKMALFSTLTVGAGWIPQSS
jgi:hypothetical protein